MININQPMSTKQMNVTVNKANKILSQINGLCSSEMYNMLNDFMAHKRCSVFVPAGEHEEFFQMKKDEFERHAELFIAVERDRMKLKDILFEYNNKSGLSEILSSLQMTQSLQSAFTSLLERVQRQQDAALVDDEFPENIARLRQECINTASNTGASIDFFDITACFTDAQTLRDIIRALKQRINALEDEKIALSAQPVTIELRQVVADELGL